jgi:hypothetical protein
MGGQPGMRRHRRAMMTAAVVGAVVFGSWFVISTATGSTPARTTRPTNNQSSGIHPAAPNTMRTTTVPTNPGPVVPNTVPVTSSSDVTTSTSPVLPTTTIKAAPPLRSTSRAVVPSQVGTESTESANAAVSLLSAIGLSSRGRYKAPVTATNISLLTRWMANEGGLWANNPLNTSHGSATYPHQITTSGQDTGIPIFPTLASGVAATAATLLSNPSYARVLRLLGSGKASCVSFARAVIRSPWASGHYGHDPAGFCSGRIVPVRRTHRRHHAG